MRRTGLAMLCLAAAAVGCTPSPAPSPVVSPVTSATASRSGSGPTYPGAEGQPPKPPDAFGEWTLFSGGLSNGMLDYRTATEGSRLAVWIGVSKAQLTGASQEPGTIVSGHWICRERVGDESGTHCETLAWQVGVRIESWDLVAADLATVGDELMAAWLS